MRVHVYCVKRVCIRSFSGPYFPAFGLNTESSEVSLRIQSECEKMRPGETPKTDTFDAVVVCYDKIIYYRDIFRILSSICDRAFLQKQLTPFIRYIFWQKRTVTDVFFCRQYASLLTKSYSHSMNSMNQVRLKKSPYNTIREESWFGQGKKRYRVRSRSFFRKGFSELVEFLKNMKQKTIIAFWSNYPKQALSYRPVYKIAYTWVY